MAGLAECCQAAYAAVLRAKDAPERLTVDGARYAIAEAGCAHLQVKGNDEMFVVYDTAEGGTDHRHILGWNGQRFY